MNTLETCALEHLKYLCLEIGPRPLGSPANRAASRYIEETFRSYRVEVERQEFACPEWVDEGTILQVNGHQHEAVANAFSPSCDVDAPAIAACTLAELESADLAGCVAILYGDLTKGHGLSCRQAFYFPERDRQIMDVLEQKRPDAVITVHDTVGSLERLIRDWEFPVPSVTVPAEVGLTLLRLEHPKVRLQIESHSSPSRFCNVVARKSGAGRERILLVAHLDTMHNTPGAIDNASGVAVLLAMAKGLGAQNRRLGLEWIAVNGEENGGLGDKEYLRRHGDSLDSVLAVINLDGIGGRVGANSLTLMGASAAFEDHICRIHERYPGVVRVEPWYESDHTAFLNRGVPCLPISSVGVANVNHMPADNVEWISPAKLLEVISLINDVVESVEDRGPGWCRAADSTSQSEEDYKRRRCTGEHSRTSAALNGQCL